jgi:hypothetical protein
LTLGHWTTADEIGTAGELITAACR